MSVLSTVRFERKGDMLSYVYLTSMSQMTQVNWLEKVDKVELLVGGQATIPGLAVYIDVAVDTQASTPPGAPSLACTLGLTTLAHIPLRFWFCENYQSAIPIVALQYHDVEIRTGGTLGASDRMECHELCVPGCRRERIWRSVPQHALYAGAGGGGVPGEGAGPPVQPPRQVYGVLCEGFPQPPGFASSSNRIKLQLNGTDVADYKYASPLHHGSVLLTFRT